MITLGPLTPSEYNILVASVMLKIERLEKLVRSPRVEDSVKVLREKLSSAQSLLDKLRKEQDRA